MTTNIELIPFIGFGLSWDNLFYPVEITIVFPFVGIELTFGSIKE